MDQKRKRGRPKGSLNVPRQPIALDRPWEELTSAERQRCESLNISREVYENNRQERDDVDTLDMITCDGVWEKPAVQLMTGGRSGVMSELERLYVTEF